MGHGMARYPVEPGCGEAHESQLLEWTVWTCFPGWGCTARATAVHPDDAGKKLARRAGVQ